MRHFIWGAALLIAAGCASQPAPVPVASAPAPSQQPAAKKSGITLGEARRLGYKIVDDHGKTMYCSDQKATGSHVRKETICLTEDELIAAREASRRNLEQMQRITPPPACGKNTGMGC